jgi:ABC-type transport system substrate-binding protein
MKNSKKLVSLLLAMAMVISLAACGGNGNEESSNGNTSNPSASNQGGTEGGDSSNNEGGAGESTGLYPELTVATSVDWKTLEPCSPNQDGRYYFLYNIYEALFDMDNTGSLVGNIATDYTLADDGMSAVVNIYDCVYDSDGNHITADDVVYSVNWLVDSGNALGYDAFDHIEKTGDYQVTWYFSEAMTGVKSLEQFFLRTMIFSETAYNSHNFATDPVGTGNYKVTNVVTGSSITLEARDDYWGSDPAVAAQREGYHTATVQKVTFQVIAEAAQAAVALEMGTVDMCGYITEDMLYEFQEGGQYADKYQVVDAMSSDHYRLNPNFAEESLCSDENLDKAIYYALNNEVIATAMGGSYIPMSGLGFTYFGDYNAAWDEEPNYINTYDPELAKEYLAKSNYKGEELTMIGLSSEAAKNAMQMMQSQLQQVGINVKLASYDQNTMEATMASRSGWDLALSKAGGTSFAGTFGAFNQKINNGWNKFWIQDEKLFELRETMSADATHDDEHVKEFVDYVLEHGYQYDVAIESNTIVIPADMTEVYLREGYFTPCACSFQ